MAYDFEAMRKDGITDKQISKAIGFDYGRMKEDGLTDEQINAAITVVPDAEVNITHPTSEFPGAEVTATAIPSRPGEEPVVHKPEPSFMEALIAGAEVTTQLGTSMTTGAFGYLTGAASGFGNELVDVLNGKTWNNKDIQTSAEEGMNRWAYRPTTEAGKELSNQVMNELSPLNALGVSPTAMIGEMPSVVAGLKALNAKVSYKLQGSPAPVVREDLTPITKNTAHGDRFTAEQTAQQEGKTLSEQDINKIYNTAAVKSDIGSSLKNEDVFVKETPEGETTYTVIESVDKETGKASKKVVDDNKNVVATALDNGELNTNSDDIYQFVHQVETGEIKKIQTTPIVDNVKDAVTGFFEKELPTTPDEVAKVIYKASKGDKGATKTLKKLAEVNEEALQAAVRLDIDLPISYFLKDTNIAKTVGLARSQAISMEESAFLHDVVKVSTIADELLNSTSEKVTNIAEASDDVKQALTKSRDELKKQESYLYRSFDESLQKDVQVELENLRELLMKTVQELGDKNRLTSTEKSLLSLAESNNITYGAMLRAKNDIGSAVGGQRTLFPDVNTYQLKQIYEAIKKDQEEAITMRGGEEQLANFKLANALTVKRKAIETKIVSGYGKKGEGSIATLITRAIQAGSKGDVTALNKLLSIVPVDMQKDVIATALKEISASKRAGNVGEFDFANFVKMYEGLRQNQQAYFTIIKAIGADKGQMLKDLHSISKTILEAQRNIIHTGKANQAIFAGLKGNTIMQNIVGKIIGYGSSKFTAGLVSPDFLFKTPQDKLQAIADLMRNPDFKQMIIEASTGKAKSTTVDKVMKTDAYKKAAKGEDTNPAYTTEEIQERVRTTNTPSKQEVEAKVEAKRQAKNDKFAAEPLTEQEKAGYQEYLDNVKRDERKSQGLTSNEQVMYVGHMKINKGDFAKVQKRNQIMEWNLEHPEAKKAIPEDVKDVYNKYMSVADDLKDVDFMPGAYIEASNPDLLFSKKKSEVETSNRDNITESVKDLRTRLEGKEQKVEGLVRSYAYGKAKKPSIVYRGVASKDNMINQSSGAASEGFRLYTTLNKDLAKDYGEVMALDGKEATPSNPLAFTDYNTYEVFMQQLMYNVAGYKRASDFGALNPNEILHIVNPDIDGIQIGKGNKTFWVKFPDINEVRTKQDYDVMFSKQKSTTLDRGTNNETDNPYGAGRTYVTRNKDFAKNYGKNIFEYNLGTDAIVLDGSKGEGRTLLKQFIEENPSTEYSKTKGTTNGEQIAWQHAYDYEKWLDNKGIEYDGIMVGESDGTLSYSLKNKDVLKKPSTNESRLTEWHKDSAPETKNEDGSPKVFYHGTGKNFSEFNTNPTSWVTESTQHANRYSKPSTLWKEGGDNVMPVYVNIKNPYKLPKENLRTSERELIIDLVNETDNAKLISDKSLADIKSILSGASQEKAEASIIWNKSQKMKEVAQILGYDGYMAKEVDSLMNKNPQFSNTLAAFNPTQIKSVFNKGTFSESNPNILMSQFKTKNSTTKAEAQKIAKTLLGKH